MTETLEHKRVLILKTNLSHREQLDFLAPYLNENAIRWSIDLEDVDRVLRIETESIDADEVIQQIGSAGFYCSELLD